MVRRIKSNNTFSNYVNRHVLHYNNMVVHTQMVNLKKLYKKHVYKLIISSLAQVTNTVNFAQNLCFFLVQKKNYFFSL